MANDPPFATLNHCAADLEIPSESVSLRVGISHRQAVNGNALQCRDLRLLTSA
jgi:hypothetical protein